jgi:hypothetical protein
LSFSAVQECQLRAEYLLIEAVVVFGISIIGKNMLANRPLKGMLRRYLIFMN